MTERGSRATTQNHVLRDSVAQSQPASLYLLHTMEDLTELTYTPTSTSNIGMSIVSPATPYTSSRADLPLTTPFAYAPDCLDRWLVSRFGSRSYLYSTSPRGSTTDPSWTSCEPLNYQTFYSPGICPEGKELAAVTESRWDAVTEWRGICCPRYMLRMRKIPGTAN